MNKKIFILLTTCWLAQTAAVAGDCPQKPTPEQIACVQQTAEERGVRMPPPPPAPPAGAEVALRECQDQTDLRKCMADKGFPRPQLSSDQIEVLHDCGVTL